MPLKGRQRSEKQKAHAATIHERRWLPKSQPEAEAISPKQRRLQYKADKKYRKEHEESKRLQYNSQRREKWLRKNLEDVEHKSEVLFEEGVEEGVRVAGERYEGKVEDLRDRNRNLSKNLARLNARNRREPSRMEHAVQKALKHSRDPDANLPIVRYVKDRRGIVQDWARNAIVTLVNEGVPISKTWSVTKLNADALGVTIVGKWSTRTSGRAVREGGIAAGLMITEYVLNCIGLCSCWNDFAYSLSTLSDHF
jgi:hypothetical protein